jgi:hypothetical protein
MYKTLVRRLGRPPRSLADYERMFSPDVRFGGWARGDGAPDIQGNGWNLWAFNDTFVTGLGGVATGLVRNTQLLVTDQGDVHWLSSGGGEPYAGAETFPNINSTTWAWVLGGYATGDDSAMVLAGGWTTGAPYSLVGYYATQLARLKSNTPTCSSVYPVGLDYAAGVSWSGLPFYENGYVYLFGIHVGELSHYIARHAATVNPAELAGAWEYWAGGSTWGNISQRVAVTIASPPLRALSVCRYNGKYLFSAKLYDSAPELTTDPDTFPEVFGWMGNTLIGSSLTSLGPMARVSRQGWHSYAARIYNLPGVPGLSSISSLNTGIPSLSSNYIYGPHFKKAGYAGDMSRTIIYVGPANSRTITSTDFNTVGVSGEPDRTWDKSNGFTVVVSDVAATYLMAQDDFVDATGLGFPDAVDDLFADGLSSCVQLGPMGATKTLNAAVSRNYAGTLSANLTITLTGGVVGETVSIIVLFLKQDPATARTVTFTPTVKWVGGTAYTASTGLGALDKIQLETADGGATWRGTFWKGFA